MQDSSQERDGVKHIGSMAKLLNTFYTVQHRDITLIVIAAHLINTQDCRIIIQITTTRIGRQALDETLLDDVLSASRRGQQASKLNAS